MDTKELYRGCPVQHALQYIGGKWQIGILFNLSKKPLRFVAIQKSLPGISEKVLTQELRFFEQKGILQRRIFPSVPPKVEYSLTTEGELLVPVLEKIIQWGYHHLQEEKITPQILSTPLSVIGEIEQIH